MSTFNGKEMLMIDIANCYGLDKVSWVDRLMWSNIHIDELEDQAETAADPMLYTKAVKALRDTEAGKPSGHAMFLDATASGLQIMAALSGCKKTARHVNLINTGKREDVYTEVAILMNGELEQADNVDRNMIKKPVMTHYYNKTRQDTLNEPQEESFYSVLSESFEGAEAVKHAINTFWDPDTLEHVWTLPDGHVAKVRVTEMISTRIEVDELNHTTFTYRFEVNRESVKSTSLVPNVIHSIDAYIAREMIRRAYLLGFELAHIHDAFCAHPNNMQKVRELYVEVLAEIADSTMLGDILSEISGTNVLYAKESPNLAQDILQCEYALS